MCLEKLIALGAEKIILYGWCGSLQKELRAMDVLVPTECLSEEGTSEHYRKEGYRGDKVIHSSPELRELLCRNLTTNGIDFQQGSLWTTDAPYRETEEKVAAYSARGISGVDMEYAALCAVAAFRGIEFAAVTLVSDELLSRPWKPEYSFKAFKKKSRHLLTLLSDMAGSL